MILISVQNYFKHNDRSKNFRVSEDQASAEINVSKMIWCFDGKADSSHYDWRLWILQIFNKISRQVKKNGRGKINGENWEKIHPHSHHIPNLTREFYTKNLWVQINFSILSYFGA